MFKKILVSLLLNVSFFSNPVFSATGEVKPEEIQEWRLKTSDGVSLYVCEFGIGDTILVIHGGFGAEHSYLIQAVAPLRNKHHFILYDQRGSLRSTCADSLTIENHIADIEKLRQTLHLRTLRILAHSMGGFLAMKYVEEFPDKIGSITLICPAPAIGSIQEMTEKLNGIVLNRWKRPEVQKTLGANGLELEHENSYTPQQNWRWQDITFAAINLHDLTKWKSFHGSAYYSAKAGEAAAKSMSSQWDFTKSLAKLSCPFQMILGDDDYIPYEYHKEWIKRVPNRMKILTIHNAGHAVWIDKPEEFKNDLQKCLLEK